MSQSTVLQPSLRQPSSISSELDHSVLDNSIQGVDPQLIHIQSIHLQSIQGGAIAGIILLTWFISFTLLLSVDVFNSNIRSNIWLIGIAIICQTFLYTGLFITAHDAMHGVVFPVNLKVNNAIGSLAVFCYGLFSYQELLRKHWLHHKYPSSDRDPDFHDGTETNFLSWYFHFMKRYWNWGRMMALVLVFHGLHYGFHVSELNLTFFWIIPSILSSVQLFYFGTFLTHREPHHGYANPHRTQSTTFSTIWSFLTCYHFGYHEEHHEYPQTPWWQLPKIYQFNRQLNNSETNLPS